MSKYEPDPEDPLEATVVGLPDPGGESAKAMAETFAEEFLALGLDSARVMELFRSPRYGLAHHAWRALGEVETFLLVSQQAALRRAIAEARARRAACSQEALHD